MIIICNFTLLAFDENSLYTKCGPSDIEITLSVVRKALQYTNIAPFLSKDPPADACYQVLAVANSIAYNRTANTEVDPFTFYLPNPNRGFGNGNVFRKWYELIKATEAHKSLQITQRPVQYQLSSNLY